MILALPISEISIIRTWVLRNICHHFNRSIIGLILGNRVYTQHILVLFYIDGQHLILYILYDLITYNEHTVFIEKKAVCQMRIYRLEITLS